MGYMLDLSYVSSYKLNNYIMKCNSAGSIREEITLIANDKQFGDLK